MLLLGCWGCASHVCVVNFLVVQVAAVPEWCALCVGHAGPGCTQVCVSFCWQAGLPLADWVARGNAGLPSLWVGASHAGGARYHAPRPFEISAAAARAAAWSTACCSSFQLSYVTFKSVPLLRCHAEQLGTAAVATWMSDADVACALHARHTHTHTYTTPPSPYRPLSTVYQPSSP